MTTRKTVTPSQTTLDRTPSRTLLFLLAISRSAVIRGALQTRGYNDQEHAAGWQKLLAVDPSMAKTPEVQPSSDPAVAEALAMLDKWDNDNLPIVDVALVTRAPEAHAFLFADELAPTDGAESVRVVITFLDRVDTLEAMAEAKPSKKPAKDGDTPGDPPLTPPQAKAAMKLLDARGITSDERVKVRGWLATLHKGTSVRPVVAPTPASLESHQAALMALYRWFDEWSTIAHKVISRRDLLIALGLATKKSSKNSSTKTSGKKTDETKKP